MTLIRGPSEEHEERGSSRVGCTGPISNIFYMMQLLVVFNDLHRAPGHAGTHEWYICHLYVNIGT